MTEIEFLHEDKSVCFMNLYPSIVQINKAKNEKICLMNLSSYHHRFFTEEFIGQYSATQAREYKLPSLSLFPKLQDICLATAL